MYFRNPTDQKTSDRAMTTPASQQLRKSGAWLHQPTAFWVGVALILVPIVLYYPYTWYVFKFARDEIVAPDNGGERYQNDRLWVWYVLTYGPFFAVSLLSGISLSIFSLSKNSTGRVLTVVNYLAWSIFSLIIATTTAAVTWFTCTVVLLWMNTPKPGIGATVPSMAAFVAVLIGVLRTKSRWKKTSSQEDGRSLL